MYSQFCDEKHSSIMMISFGAYFNFLMAAMSNQAVAENKTLEVLHPSDVLLEELRHSKREIELLKAMDPFRAAEMALEIQVERLRVTEALAARDNVVQRLTEAYNLIRHKTAVIDKLQSEIERLRDTLQVLSSNHDSANDTMTRSDGEAKKLEGIISKLQDEIGMLKLSASDSAKSVVDPPPRYEDGRNGASMIMAPSSSRSQLTVHPETSRIPFTVLRQNSDKIISSTSTQKMPIAQFSAQLDQENSLPASKMVVDDSNGLDYKVVESTSTQSDEPEEMAKARNAILAALPLPVNVPGDELQPIVIPPPFTLHEFLGNASGSLRNSLLNYRMFQQLTTSWCPEREEHGYLLTPAFKCSTNPRVATAHRWSAVDVVARMSKPTECFYNRDGSWYYAGVYKGFRLPDLTTKEWEALSTETSQALVKETIVCRKNTSPQNVYETSQLYAAGALKVACVGLKCVGFNMAMYKTILEQADRCAREGKWSAAGEAGVLWNSSATGSASVGEADDIVKGTRKS